MAEVFDRNRGSIEGQGGAERGKRLILGIGLVWLLLGAATAPLAPILDPDEGYYPATAAETLRTGAFWDLRFNDAPRWEKPLLGYALIEAAFVAFGENVTTARLPSAIQGAFLLVIVGTTVTRMAGARAGVLSALVVGTSLGFSIFTRVAHPEIAIVLSIATTDLLMCWWLVTNDAHTRRRLAVAVGVSLAYGILAKGPVAVALPALALVAIAPFVWKTIDFPRFIRHMTLATVVAAVLAAPWYLAMTLRHGMPFLYESLWAQNVGRYSIAAYGHRAGFLSLVLPTLIGCLPWTGLLPAANRRTPIRTDVPRDVLRLYMLLSALTAFAFYSLSSSKLPSYAFVCVPPFAITVGLWLDQKFDGPREIVGAWRSASAVLVVCAAVLLVAPFVAGSFVTPQQLLGGVRPPTSDMRVLLAPLTIPLGCLLGGAGLLLARTDNVRWRIAALAAVGALAPVFLLIAARPTLQAMYPYETLAQHIAQSPDPVWLLGRRAPSLTFYTSRPVPSIADGVALSEELAKGSRGWLVLTRDEWTLLSKDDMIQRHRGEVAADAGRMVLVRFDGLPPEVDNTAPKSSDPRCDER